MRTILLSLLGAALWAQAPAPPPATAPAAADPVVLTMNGRGITKSQFEGILQGLPANVRAQASSPEGKRQIAERLAEMEILSAEALRIGLDKDPSVAAQLRMQQQSLLASAMYQRLESQSKMTDAEAQAAYDARKSEFEVAKSRHILVRFKGSRVPVRQGGKDLTDAEALAKAKEIHDRLVKGEDFATVAKAESDDTGSGAQGGDLGENPRGRFVAEYDNAAFTLPLNQISDPVKSQFGYHIIQVTERGFLPLAKVRPELEREKASQAADEAIKALREKAGLKFDEAYFSAPKPEPGTPKPGLAAPAPAGEAKK